MVMSGGDGSSRPSRCRCGQRRFHRHGSYLRVVARAVVERFICPLCGLTVSMVPSSCVPFKHHPVRVINPVLEGMLLQGRSGRHYEREDPAGIAGSTACRWRREFAVHAPTLATEGAGRVGVGPVAGRARDVYGRLKERFAGHGEGFFMPLQVALCGRFPPLGVFRTLGFRG
jgi:hypothetical protein